MGTDGPERDVRSTLYGDPEFPGPERARDDVERDASCNCGMSPPGNNPAKPDYEPSGHWPSCPAYDPLAGLTPKGRRIVEDFIRQSQELVAAHERLDIYAVPAGPIVERLEWWFQQDSETLDQLIKLTEASRSSAPRDAHPEQVYYRVAKWSPGICLWCGRDCEGAPRGHWCGADCVDAARATLKTPKVSQGSDT